MTDPFAQMLDDVMEALGQEAVYFSPEGAETPIKLMPSLVDDTENFGNSTRLQSSLSIFEVNKSALALPVQGGVIRHKGIDYLIKNPPRHPDDDKNMWLLECSLYRK